MYTYNPLETPEIIAIILKHVKTRVLRNYYRINKTWQKEVIRELSKRHEFFANEYKNLSDKVDLAQKELDNCRTITYFPGGVSYGPPLIRDPAPYHEKWEKFSNEQNQMLHQQMEVERIIERYNLKKYINSNDMIDSLIKYDDDDCSYYSDDMIDSLIKYDDDDCSYSSDDDDF
jgi:hypothetical protein